MEKTKEILLNTYWGRGGWKKYDISENELKYSVDHGAMSKTICISYFETLEKNKRVDWTYKTYSGRFCIYASSVPEHQITNKINRYFLL